MPGDKAPDELQNLRIEPAEEVRIRVEGAISNIPAAEWDACANPEGAIYNPFISHAFLRCLEESGCVSDDTGWSPRHLVLDGESGPRAVMPLYLKSNSMGEFVFDHAFADAYHQAGGAYYPKLQCAAPFTPASGRRILVRDVSDIALAERILTQGALQLMKAEGASSLHITFPTHEEWGRLGDAGLQRRTGMQFHWRNDGYATFDDFLGAFSSRKRKAVKKERRDALASGLTVEWLTGAQLTEAHWDGFFRFYLDTGDRKWGRPYLNRRFFSLIGAAMPDRILLMMVKEGGRYIAGALNFISGDALYGRYWGCVEERPYLHFEVCYYQAIDFAIAHGLARVEAGAQGEHKLARGYLPEITYSLHAFAHPGLGKAVADYLKREMHAVEAQRAELMEASPFKKTGDGDV
ncbi:MAG: GNAT family N-acetyltransferase [Hyphomicrobiales bacterium]|nr:GNAT family N-acetyltransferase [Hyphomicrobiales bacterium]